MKKFSLVLLSSMLVALGSCASRDVSSSVNSTGKEPDTPASSVKPDQPASKIKDGIRVAYQMAGENIIRGEVNVKDEKAVKVHFDEVNVAIDKFSATTQTEGDNVISGQITSGKQTSVAHHAKYINVNGKIWTGAYIAKNGDTPASFRYTNGNDEFTAYYNGLTSQKDLADFYYALVNGYVYGSDAQGKEIKGLIAPIYSKASKDSTYWTYVKEGQETIQGSRWKWNIHKIEQALTGKDLHDETAITKESTGATINSFNTYLEIAKKAYLGTSKVVEEFGLDHKDCFSKTELVYGADNRVAAAYINETNQFLTMLGQRKDNTSNDAPTVTFEVAAKDDNPAQYTYYSQYINVNGTVWTGTAKVQTENRENVTYANGTNTDALAYYASSSSLAQDYYNAQFLHQITIAKDANGAATSDQVNYGNATATKAELDNTYWITNGRIEAEKTAPTDYPTWWKWNIAAVQKAFIGLDFTTMDASKVDTDIVKKGTTADEGGHTYYSINNVQTGSTMSETNSYVKFAIAASAYLIK